MKKLALALLIFPAQATATTPPPDLSGSWAQLQVQTSVATIPIVGDVQTRTISWLRLDITQNGERLKITSTPCRIDLKSEVDLVRSIIPQPMLNAIGTQTFRARLQAKDAQWQFYQPPAMQLLGLKLEDPWKETLPKNASDTRVFDADQDGNPGVTVRIEGAIDGAVYVAQRSWSRLEGLVNNDQITGRVTWQTEQVVLDATSSLLANPPNARTSNNPADSYFVSKRIAADTTCEDIARMPMATFPR